MHKMPHFHVRSLLSGEQGCCLVSAACNLMYTG